MMIHSNYRKLLSAYFLSSLGDWLYKLALPLFLYQKTGSALVMAVTYGLTFLPFVIVTPLGGVIADRLSRRQMLIRGDYLSFILTLVLAVLVLSHTDQLWSLYLLVFLIAAVNSIYHPIFQSIIPELIAKENLAKANAYINSSENLILLLGPAVSGLVIALLGPAIAICVNAVSFLISAIFIQRIKITTQPVSAVKISVSSLLHDLKAGFIYSYRHPIVKFGCLIFILMNFGVQLVLANFMFYLANGLQLSPLDIGLTYTLIGIGAVTGSMLAPVLSKHVAAGKLILLSCMGVGITTGLLTFSNNYLGIGITGGLMFGCMSVVIVTYFTLRQKVVPNEYLGRVIATTRLISYCAIPLASIVGGWLLQQHIEFKHLIWLGSAIMIVDAAIGWFTPLRQKSLNFDLEVNKQ